ncbi:MAG TPA: hypothetical protein VFY10_08065 [Dehalococcoidia bacterium]|nr:hypothetical protein [Dehalococcoidia bacterium]
MIVFLNLVAFGVPLLIAAAVVRLVQSMLLRHKPTEKELRQLELDDRNGVPAMMLPTLTTEGTGQVGRDPEFEMDALAVRVKGWSGF